jgi:cytochrome c6
LKYLLLSRIVVVSVVAGSAGCLNTARAVSGEAVFREKCSMCHPDGGNIMNGPKGLKRSDLLKNNIKNATDIVAYLRKPGPNMPTFDVKSLSDKEASTLADYILNTFN